MGQKQVYMHEHTPPMPNILLRPHTPSSTEVEMGVVTADGDKTLLQFRQTWAMCVSLQFSRRSCGKKEKREKGICELGAIQCFYAYCMNMECGRAEVGGWPLPWSRLSPGNFGHTPATTYLQQKGGTVRQQTVALHLTKADACSQ